MQEETNYVRRSQRDYSTSLKVQIVREIENGHLSTVAACRKYGIQARSTVVGWLRKYGNLDWENQTPSSRAIGLNSTSNYFSYFHFFSIFKMD